MHEDRHAHNYKTAVNSEEVPREDIELVRIKVKVVIYFSVSLVNLLNNLCHFFFSRDIFIFKVSSGYTKFLVKSSFFPG